MSIAEYLEQAINELLETDNTIKAQFYFQPDAPVSEKLHRQHHHIKKWVGQLQEIKTEILADEAVKETSQFQLPAGVYFVISRSDMKDKAYGIIDGSRFKVLTGSFIAPTVSENMYEIVKRLRNDYAGFINTENILTKDLGFDNPGQAARFVTGKQLNGIEEWKMPDGITLKEYSKNNTDNLTGISDLAFKKPKTVIIFNEKHTVSTWRDVLIIVCETVYKRNQTVVLNLPNDERMNSKRRATFASDKTDIKVRPIRLSCGIWVEANQSASSVLRISRNLLSISGFDPSALRIEIHK